MNGIVLQVSDPTWWFTAVFVGFIISLLAGFSQNWIARQWGRFSDRQREKNIMRALTIEESARRCIVDPTYFQANNGTLTFLSAVTVIFALICAVLLFTALTVMLASKDTAGAWVVGFLLGGALLMFAASATVFQSAMFRAEVAQRVEGAQDAGETPESAASKVPKKPKGPPHAPTGFEHA